jgi:exosortase A-associated hydrolase 2
LEAFFLPVEPGERLCVYHPACGVARRGGVLYVHPFGEEMNKSRRMAALQARAFAQAGWDVLLLDLYGCGDSSGDFGDATWEIWQNDVDAGWHWLTAKCNGPVWLWGLRIGALLAATVVARSGRPAPLLLWQPTVSGQRFVRQFFRTRLISEAITAGARQTTAVELLKELETGRPIEVAGYALGARLLLPIERAAMPTLPIGSVVRWVEISDSGDVGVSPAASTTLAAWQSADIDARFEFVTGPQFWQTQEICECVPLIKSSLSLLGA